MESDTGQALARLAESVARTAEALGQATAHAESGRQELQTYAVALKEISGVIEGIRAIQRDYDRRLTILETRGSERDLVRSEQRGERGVMREHWWALLVLVLGAILAEVGHWVTGLVARVKP